MKKSASAMNQKNYCRKHHKNDYYRASVALLQPEIEGETWCLVSAVIDWAIAGDITAAAIGQVLPDVEMKKGC